MKKKALPITFFFMILFSFTFSQGKKTVYYDKDWEEIAFKDSAYYYRKVYFDEYGNELGKVMDYTLSGKLIMEGNFADRGVRNGDFTWYDENGHKTEYAFYKRGLYFLLQAWDKDGKKVVNNGNGKIKRYYENGSLKEEGNYEKGQRVGRWITYHRNGQKFEDGIYEGDAYILSNSWNQQGENIIVGGNGEYILKYNNGQIKQKGIYEDGLKQGIWIKWYSNGQMYSKSIYENGFLQGEYVWWFPFGKMHSNGKYRNGKRQGKWIFYREDESILYISYFDNGIYTDQVIDY